jgi:phage/plasmid-associated DNA primase
MAITCENMTSGFKFKDDVTFQAKALHLMSGNGSFSSSKHIDEGLKRRLCVINFGNKIESEIVITDFSDQIVNEESDLILSFALWGARSLIKQSKDGRGELSYDIPKSCDDELEDWLDKDSVRSYVKTQLVVSESAFISSQDAYDNYKKYCKENGEKHVVSLKTFVTTLKTLLPGAYKATEKQRGFKGYCLVGAVSDEDSETLLETKIWNFFNECRSIHTVEIQEETNSSNQKGLAVKIDLNGNEVKHTRDLYGYYKENELYVFCNSIYKVIGRSSDLSCLPHTFYKGIQRRTINGVRQRFHVFVLEEAQEVASSTHINTTSNNVIQLNPKENHLSHKEYHSIPLSEMEETTL